MPRKVCDYKKMDSGIEVADAAVMKTLTYYSQHMNDAYRHKIESLK